MKKYVMVNAVSMFNMKYCLEVPEDLAEGDMFDYVSEKVRTGNVKELTQKHIGENVTNYEIVDQKEILKQFRKDEPIFGEWTDERIMKMVTPIDFDAEQYYKEEEERWKSDMN